MTDKPEITKKTQRRRGGKAHTPGKQFEACKGDQQLMNTVNFMRMTFWYREFCASVAEGDPGRVHEIIKV